ncbi:hypothetical protein F5141DRAFT_1059273 [Pisolithus sp. B1]|nr:hypothetical protein F5141DRAFT_1059273 [Pisolithus sp. B1]
MDITEIISGSKDKSSTPPSPFPHSHHKFEFGPPNLKSEEGKQSHKHSQYSQDVGLGSTSQMAPVPPSKQAKTAPHSTSSSQCCGSGVNKSILQEIWDTVYGGNIEHAVAVGGLVFQIAKQSLNNCHHYFFANDADFENLEEHIEFAKAMLIRNHFLCQNRGTDSKLWRSLCILQTFAHHFNYIQGKVEVSTLDIELGGPHTALALSCTAVCQVLTLVSNNNISFGMIKLRNVWNAVIPKGTQYELNDAVWGATTRHFFEPIKGLSEEQFALVVEETHKFVKMTAIHSVDSAKVNSKVEELFTFC